MLEPESAPGPVPATICGGRPRQGLGRALNSSRKREPVPRRKLVNHAPATTFLACVLMTALDPEPSDDFPGSGRCDEKERTVEQPELSDR